MSDPGMIGADAPALFNFARALRDRMNQIEETRNRLTAVIEGLEWVGQDREQFLQQWQTIHNPGIATLVADLLGVSQDVESHAQLQEQTSSGY